MSSVRMGNFSGTRDLPVATQPRAEQGWLRPVGFDPPAVGGSCSVLTNEGNIWCGTVLAVERPRVEVRLFGSNVLATFVGCKVAPLKPHSRADARQIFERQRARCPAATFTEKEIK